MSSNTEVRDVLLSVRKCFEAGKTDNVKQQLHNNCLRAIVLPPLLLRLRIQEHYFARCVNRCDRHRARNKTIQYSRSAPLTNCFLCVNMRAIQKQLKTRTFSCNGQ
jgi:hypothetical protein